MYEEPEIERGDGELSEFYASLPKLTISEDTEPKAAADSALFGVAEEKAESAQV